MRRRSAIALGHPGAGRLRSARRRAGCRPSAVASTRTRVACPGGRHRGGAARERPHPCRRRCRRALRDVRPRVRGDGVGAGDDGGETDPHHPDPDALGLRVLRSSSRRRPSPIPLMRRTRHPTRTESAPHADAHDAEDEAARRALVDVERLAVAMEAEGLRVPDAVPADPVREARGDGLIAGGGAHGLPVAMVARIALQLGDGRPLDVHNDAARGSRARRRQARGQAWGPRLLRERRRRSGERGEVNSSDQRATFETVAMRLPSKCDGPRGRERAERANRPTSDRLGCAACPVKGSLDEPMRKGLLERWSQRISNRRGGLPGAWRTTASRSEPRRRSSSRQAPRRTAWPSCWAISCGRTSRPSRRRSPTSTPSTGAFPSWPTTPTWRSPWSLPVARVGTLTIHDGIVGIPDVTIRGPADAILALSNMPLATPLGLPFPAPGDLEAAKTVRDSRAVPPRGQAPLLRDAPAPAARHEADQGHERQRLRGGGVPASSLESAAFGGRGPSPLDGRPIGP